jgi:adenosylmethionine-8-amino-7-oxononanoate aminotransferase
VVAELERGSLRHAGRKVTLVVGRAGGAWSLADGGLVHDLSGAALADSLRAVVGEEALDVSLLMPSSGFETPETLAAERRILDRGGTTVGGCLWSSSGSTAVETAVATVSAALFGRDLPDTIIVREGAYHGATYLGRKLSARASHESRRVGDCRVVVLPETGIESRDADELLMRIGGARAGDTMVLLESVPTTGRHFDGGSGYVQALARGLSEAGIPLVLDEVASGAYRHGWFTRNEALAAHPPAAVALAKGLTAGRLPLACTLVRQDVAAFLREQPAQIPRFTIGLTDGAAHLMTATLAALDRVRPALPQRATLLATFAARLRAQTAARVEHTATTLRLTFGDAAALERARVELSHRRLWCYAGSARFHDGDRGFLVLCPPLDLTLDELAARLDDLLQPLVG